MSHIYTVTVVGAHRKQPKFHIMRSAYVQVIPVSQKLSFSLQFLPTLALYNGNKSKVVSWSFSSHVGHKAATKRVGIRYVVVSSTQLWW